MAVLSLQTAQMSASRARGYAAAYVLAYIGLVQLGAATPVLKLSLAPWCPETGLALAFVILAGPNRAWLTGLGALMADLVVNGPASSWVAQACSAALLAASYEIAGRLLRLPTSSTAFDSSSSMLRLVAVSVGLGLALALSSMLEQVTSAALSAAELINTLTLRWVGYSNGMLTLTPLILVASRWRAGLRALLRRRWELLAQALTIGSVLGLILWLRFTGDLRFFYPLFVPMVWVAFRWGVSGTACYMLLMQMGLMIAVWHDPHPPLLTFTGPHFLLLTLSVTGLLLASVVAEWRASEARLRERDATLGRAMRFAAVGELASALTHELNQPITALVSYLRASNILAEPFVERDLRLSQTLDKAAHEAIRAAEVLNRLRDFYRGGAPQLTVVRLEEVTHSVFQRHEERLRHMRVEPRQLFEPDLPALICDRTRLEIVLHNLLGNALDAIATRNETQREIAMAIRTSGAHVLVSIEDSGPGVSADVAAHLFDPFVTTKPDGMGLGLAISRSLLRGQGGELWAEPSALGGARFVLRMPLIASAQASL